MVNRILKSIDYLGGKYIYIAVCVFIMIIFVGSSFGIDRTPAPKATKVEDLAQKNAFENGDVTDIEFDGIMYSIPDYYVADTQESDHLSFYAGTTKKDVIFQILYEYDDEDEVSYRMLEQETSSGLMTESFESWFDDCKVVEITKLPNDVYMGFIYKCTCTIRDLDCEAYIVCFPIVKTNSWGYITYTKTKDAQNIYDADFLRILESMTPAT